MFSDTWDQLQLGTHAQQRLHDTQYLHLRWFATNTSSPAPETYLPNSFLLLPHYQTPHQQSARPYHRDQQGFLCQIEAIVLAYCDHRMALPFAVLDTVRRSTDSFFRHKLFPC